MNTRTNIVLDDELITLAMARARVTTKKAAVEAALRAYVRRPDLSALLALQTSDPIDPDYDPKGPYGLTPAALAQRGWKTFEDARYAFEKQVGVLSGSTAKKPTSSLKRAPSGRRKKSDLIPA